ncbi:hypothetical protein D082_29910 [Synechocystis sp. PCC 6714]|nr:hypothetical protein D082_29910 [Synechocystis sp. PCC 6714]
MTRTTGAIGASAMVIASLQLKSLQKMPLIIPSKTSGVTAPPDRA